MGLIKLKLLSVPFWQSRGCFIVMYTCCKVLNYPSGYENIFILFLDLNWQYLNLFSAFLFYKGILKIYKGEYASEPFWHSFLTQWSNQSNFLTGVPHFYRRFSRHPYQVDLCPSSVIADIWNMSIMSDVIDDKWQMADISHIDGCLEKRQ